MLNVALWKTNYLNLILNNMEISKHLIYKNLHFLAIEQLAEEYKSLGYQVEKEKRIGNFVADLIVSKDDEKIVFEVKSRKMDSSQKEHLAKLADYINSLGEYKFKIIVASPPTEKTIDIVDFEQILYDYIIQDLPSELDMLSTHTFVEEISTIEIHNIILHENNEINVIGEGVVEVKLQFGSDGDQRRDDGHINYDSFPFTFDLYLSYSSENELYIKSENSLEIDTDSYYG